MTLTIGEIETETGMTRANIRYYEQEGLLSPRREENGYRDYSAEDLVLLRRIRLLRALGVPLAELRALRDGSVSLSDALGERLAALGAEREAAARAQDVCRAIRSDGATFATLDAEKYLRGDFGAPVPPSDAVPRVACPWRRYFARAFDLALCAALWTAFLALVCRADPTRGRAWPTAISFLSLGAALLLEPVFLRLTGATPGKWLLGLRLEDDRGRRPSLAEGFSRTGRALFYGCGAGIPIYSLVRLWKSFSACRNGEALPWEDELTLTLRDRKKFRPVLLAAAYALVLAAAVLALLAAQFPPNRGDVTVAQFAENYNDLAAYAGLSGQWILAPDGRWTERDRSGGTFVYDLGGRPSDFSYQTDDGGALTAVSFAFAAGSGAYFEPPVARMKLAALAFALARRDVPLGAPEAVGREIALFWAERHEFSAGGAQISWEPSYEGCEALPDSAAVVPLDEGEMSYRLSFQMTKP